MNRFRNTPGSRVAAGRIGLPVVGALVLAGLLCVGCESNKATAESTFFPPENQPRQVDLVMAAQASAGAAEHATLYAQDFTGGELNALGRSKLHLMLQDLSQDEPLLVYLDMPEKEANLADRKQSIQQYIENAGLPADRLELKMGQNPASGFAAKEQIDRVKRTESGAQIDGGAGMSPDSAPPSPAGGMRPSGY